MQGINHEAIHLLQVSGANNGMLQAQDAHHTQVAHAMDERPEGQSNAADFQGRDISVCRYDGTLLFGKALDDVQRHVRTRRARLFPLGKLADPLLIHGIVPFEKVVVDVGLVLRVGKVGLRQLHEDIAARVTLWQVTCSLHHVFRHAAIQKIWDFRKHGSTAAKFLRNRLRREASLVCHRFHGNGLLAFATRYINSGFQDNHPPGSPIQLVHLFPHHARD